MKRFSVVGLSVLVFLGGCAGRLPTPDPAPALLTPERSDEPARLRGRLELTVMSRTIRQEAIVERTDESFRLVVLGPSPQPWLEAELSAEGFSARDSEQPVRFPIDPERFLGDFQLALRKHIQTAELDSFRVEEDRDAQPHRTIIGPGGTYARIHYESRPPTSGPFTFRSSEQSYEFRFVPVSFGED